MKRYFILLNFFFIFGCSNDSVENTSYTNDNSSEESWAFEFVRYNEFAYIITKEEVSKNNLGESIGSVQRNITDLDVEKDLEERDFDSNVLDIGTELFLFKDKKNEIVYKEGNSYFLAKKSE